jgi:hypothetical protein
MRTQGQVCVCVRAHARVLTAKKQKLYTSLMVTSASVQTEHVAEEDQNSIS